MCMCEEGEKEELIFTSESLQNIPPFSDLFLQLHIL